jgi:hypothetical protein
MYLTTDKHFAMNYGWLHVAKVHKKELGTLKKYQYFFEFVNDIKDKDDQTQYLIDKGYDGVIIGGGYEIIILNPEKIKLLESKLIRYSDYQRGAELP